MKLARRNILGRWQEVLVAVHTRPRPSATRGRAAFLAGAQGLPDRYWSGFYIGRRPRPEEGWGARPGPSVCVAYVRGVDVSRNADCGIRLLALQFVAADCQSSGEPGSGASRALRGSALCGLVDVNREVR